MTSFPALTIWQPWATLIMAGAKPHEFRGWAAPRHVRGRRIAIHAGARPVRLSELRALRLQLRGDNATGLDAEIALPLLERWTQDPSTLPLASVLGTAVMGEPVKAHEIPAYAGRFVNDSDRDDHANFAWPLADIQIFMPPIPAKGAQGFWKWTAPVEAMADV
ncbi:hypothetical protein [Methylobacterium sp. sgz302541]|uniref:hypothetical protein n=1 Tax=unclassified Methylobacterium TaxID=2615210 RepID=UPI003D358941